MPFLAVHVAFVFVSTSKVSSDAVGCKGFIRCRFVTPMPQVRGLSSHKHGLPLNKYNYLMCLSKLVIVIQLFCFFTNYV